MSGRICRFKDAPYLSDLVNLIMFDIDGTLTRTDVADETCFVKALQETFGFTEIETDWSTYPHCSDSAILDAIFIERLGRSPSNAEIGHIQAKFTDLLREETRSRPFEAISGVQDLLQMILSEGRHAISLATGGWECSARLKLAAAGIEFTEFPAAFADDAHAREDIMKISLTRALKLHRRETFDQVIYVGDGVWDGRASRSLGYPFIGIASDAERAWRLMLEGASKVFSDYSDPAAFLTEVEASARG